MKQTAKEAGAFRGQKLGRCVQQVGRQRAGTGERRSRQGWGPGCLRGQADNLGQPLPGGFMPLLAQGWSLALVHALRTATATHWIPERQLPARSQLMRLKPWWTHLAWPGRWPSGRALVSLPLLRRDGRDSVCLQCTQKPLGQSSGCPHPLWGRIPPPGSQSWLACALVLARGAEEAAIAGSSWPLNEVGCRLSRRYSSSMVPRVPDDTMLSQPAGRRLCDMMPLGTRTAFRPQARPQLSCEGAWREVVRGRGQGSPR